MKKWNDRKIFKIFSFQFGWKWKSGGMEKISLYKFTHIPLLKNDRQLKQKSDQQRKKEETITQFIGHHQG